MDAMSKGHEGVFGFSKITAPEKVKLRNPIQE